MTRLLLLLATLVVTWPALAVVEPYVFETAEKAGRYQHFTEVLRCPKCQNQNLAGSDAAIAADLREELRRLVAEGRSNEEIRDFMVSRYGEFVLYKPPVDRNTVALWAAPAIFAALGFSVLGFLLVRNRRADGDCDVELDAADNARIDALLAEGRDAPAAAIGHRRRGETDVTPAGKDHP